MDLTDAEIEGHLILLECDQCHQNLAATITKVVDMEAGGRFAWTKFEQHSLLNMRAICKGSEATVLHIIEYPQSKLL